MATTRVSRLLKPDDSVLLLIDIQEKRLTAMSNPEAMLERVNILVQASVLLKIPILVTEQVPHKLGPTQASLRKQLPLEAAFFPKTAFGCGNDPDLLAFLASLNRKQVLLCGMETHVCVSQSAHQLLQEGYQIHLATDAVQSRHKKDQKTALLKMQQSGVIPTTAEMALFEWLGDSEHPMFKSIQALIKS